ncbi:hypothetical protein F7725_008830 [Dissostichus mawsoni]|uniref:Uncharacterized protein n=1 Tax=Dissostichus mawsoni TaxID=36200 RepID=A0A7J5Z717_DISMA|nr:hypothetical protein F7725_008830 [Dissostichus mawsoni]
MSSRRGPSQLTSSPSTSQERVLIVRPASDARTLGKTKQQQQQNTKILFCYYFSFVILNLTLFADSQPVLPGQYSTVGRPASCEPPRHSGEEVKCPSRRIRAPRGRGMSSLMASLTSSPTSEVFSLPYPSEWSYPSDTTLNESPSSPSSSSHYRSSSSIAESQISYQALSQSSSIQRGTDWSGIGQGMRSVSGEGWSGDPCFPPVAPPLLTTPQRESPPPSQILRSATCPRAPASRAKPPVPERKSSLISSPFSSTSSLSSCTSLDSSAKLPPPPPHLLSHNALLLCLPSFTRQLLYLLDFLLHPLPTSLLLFLPHLHLFLPRLLLLLLLHLLSHLHPSPLLPLPPDRLHPPIPTLPNKPSASLQIPLLFLPLQNSCRLLTFLLHLPLLLLRLFLPHLPPPSPHQYSASLQTSPLSSLHKLCRASSFGTSRDRNAC